MLSRRRSAKKRAAAFGYSGKHFTTEEWFALLEHYGGVCLACGAGEAKDLSVDHVVPLSKGGPNTITNIQPLCGTCNSLKGAAVRDYRPSFAGAVARRSSA
jgi:5-methylcytosine-specific restriction endonuclease McrA